MERVLITITPGRTFDSDEHGPDFSNILFSEIEEVIERLKQNFDVEADVQYAY